MKILGWLFTIVGALVYLLLWLGAFQFIDEQIGWFWTLVLLIFSNIIGPVLFMIWYWVKIEFPTIYFIVWLVSLIVYWVGNIMRAYSSGSRNEY